MHLLIVEDDRICKFMSTRIAETSGLFTHIESVENGKDAFELLLKADGTVPDVILLDLNMPLMNGFEFIQAVRQLSFPGGVVPAIVVVTSSIDDREHRRVRDLGVAHCLSKPLAAKDMHIAVRSLVNERRSGGQSNANGVPII